MSDEADPKVRVLETHEELMQQIERGSSTMRALAWVTVVVAVLLIGSYVGQLLTPYVTGNAVVTVDLTDPALQGAGVLVILLTLAWLYVGVRNLLFTRRMTNAIREVRAMEKDVEKRLSARP
ncbi:MAG: hypothetical protein JRN11_08335 [Nitrososphaerota archaeon]|jgi:uncharacterized membrane protein (DUF485 family)|nr:hypothetical protein [Nitrososphaerota archaeon]MDG6972745.1 hypothetical protein [Nitrososphaerota archaeon]MDG6974026.1 hypothetical protein [Nitrososphaerota archaeon]MDG6987566.1 hypothetical protein [Nitrososphaerota archaeon]MDG7026742.1 hypothetical protein [Nitrososphaerota archaeon]